MTSAVTALRFEVIAPHKTRARTQSEPVEIALCTARDDQRLPERRAACSAASA
jgi:hypothetical protein